MKKKQLQNKSEGEQKAVQARMDLHYRGVPFFQRIIYRLRRSYRILDQIKYWRSFVLWLNIYINILTPFLLLSWLVPNLSKLPDELPLLFYYADPIQRFLPTQFVAVVIGLNLVVQIISISIGSRLLSKLRALSSTLLIFSALTSVLVYISLYKALIIVTQ